MSEARIWVGDVPFGDVTRLRIVRDLEELSGSAEVEGVDAARLAAAAPAWWHPEAARGPFRPGEALRVELHGEPVLRGWVDEIRVGSNAGGVTFKLAGRDVTGDLVDCAAAPHGPAEFRNLTLLDLCRALCRPFGIAVRAEVDLPGRFPRFGIDTGETVLSAIEKGCRQRGVLALSDGLGALVLTRGGRGTAPEALRHGDNIVGAEAHFGHAERWSEYLVKGQSAPATRGRPALIATANPLVAGPVAPRLPPTAPGGPRARVVMTGRAVDPAVRRHRPTVAMARTQSGGATVQEQADWAMRTARARSENLVVTVAGWRAGPDARLWRPNERVLVEDPILDVAHELLIAAVTYTLGEEGRATELRLAGVEAFDLLAEGEERERRARRDARRAGRMIDKAEVLTAAAPPPAGRR